MSGQKVSHKGAYGIKHRAGVAFIAIFRAVAYDVVIGSILAIIFYGITYWRDGYPPSATTALVGYIVGYILSYIRAYRKTFHDFM